MSAGESRIDELFEKLYGFKPKKKGTAYELLVAAAFKLLLANSQVKADQQFSDGKKKSCENAAQPHISPFNFRIGQKLENEREQQRDHDNRQQPAHDRPGHDEGSPADPDVPLNPRADRLAEYDHWRPRAGCWLFVRCIRDCASGCSTDRASIR